MKTILSAMVLVGTLATGCVSSDSLDERDTEQLDQELLKWPGPKADELWISRFTRSEKAPKTPTKGVQGAEEDVGALGGPDPSKVYIESITYGGTGCPQGSVGQSLSDDRTTFTLIFDKYIASTGRGIPVTEGRKACQLSIHLRVPSGWAYTIATLTYRGYANLNGKSTAEQHGTYYLAAGEELNTFKSKLTGPITRDYVLTDTFGLHSVVSSSCGARIPVNVNSAVSIIPITITGSSLLTNDSIDGKVKHIHGLTWKSC